MTAGDTAFTGNIPELYQQNLVPLLFAPWAALLARRVASVGPGRILETASGTGVLTAELARACPDAEIVATDLNSAMLEVAREQVPSSVKVDFVVADACALPFDDLSVDAAASQFGIMFYPDRVKGYAEAARVLKPGAPLVAALWGSLDENPVSAVIQQAMESAFPADPPRFLRRTPFSCHDADRVIAEAEDGGFELVSVERVTLPHPRMPATTAADGMVLGSPLRAAVEERGADGLRRALDAAREAVAGLADGDGRIASTMTALIVTAQR